MKKFLLVLTTFVLLILLAGCHVGEVTSNIEITNTAGAGTKTINLKLVYDNGFKRNGDPVEDNSKYLIGGTEGVLNTLKKNCALEDATFEITERNKEEDYDVITITYSFDSIDEYNEKTKIFADGHAEIEPATLTVDGDKVTFSEAGANLKNSILWGMKAVFHDPEVYDDNNDSQVKEDNIASIFEVVVTVGDTSEEYHYNDAVPTTMEVTGTVPEPGEEPADETPAAGDETPVESPKTSDNGIMYLLVMVMLAGTAVLYTRKRAVS